MFTKLILCNLSCKVWIVFIFFWYLIGFLVCKNALDWDVETRYHRENMKSAWFSKQRQILLNWQGFPLPLKRFQNKQTQWLHCKCKRREFLWNLNFFQAFFAILFGLAFQSGLELNPSYSNFQTIFSWLDLFAPATLRHMWNKKCGFLIKYNNYFNLFLCSDLQGTLKLQDKNLGNVLKIEVCRSEDDFLSDVLVKRLLIRGSWAYNFQALLSLDLQFGQFFSTGIFFIKAKVKSSSNRVFYRLRKSIFDKIFQPHQNRPPFCINVQDVVFFWINGELIEKLNASI